MKHPVKSPLRYPGGKTRALRQILARLPDDIGEYREPFIGGGSVFLAVKGRYAGRIHRYWINDLNPDLCEFWRVAQEANAALARQIEHLREQFPDGRDLYRHLKDRRHIHNYFDRAVRFFIINRISFSGTVDSGGYSHHAFENRFTPSSVERLRALEPHLRGVQITQGDYAPLLAEPGEGVFLFLDPPYWSATQSRLYGQQGDLHTGFDHERFAQQMRDCPHRWLITYDDSPFIRELFSFAHIETWTLQYGMNNYKQGSAAAGQELFIRNY